MLTAGLLLMMAAGVVFAGQESNAPKPRGCISETSAGDHTYTCEGLRVDARVPTACVRPGCGLVLDVHGDTGTGLLEDAHTRLRDLGERAGYIVIAPTGPPIGFDQPGSTWLPTDDVKLVTIVRGFVEVFGVDVKRVHVTGFSRGGYTTWRLMCNYADLFASAAPAGPGATKTGPCFVPGRSPSRKVPILILMGRTDRAVPLELTTKIRDAAIASYAATGPTLLAGDAKYTHNRWVGPDGVVIEVFEHGYENPPDGSWGGAKGHCYPGSTVDPKAQYGLTCEGPTAFNWGEQVMLFFQRHPKS